MRFFYENYEKSNIMRKCTANDQSKSDLFYIISDPNRLHAPALRFQVTIIFSGTKVVSSIDLVAWHIGFNYFSLFRL